MVLADRVVPVATAGVAIVANPAAVVVPAAMAAAAIAVAVVPAAAVVAVVPSQPASDRISNTRGGSDKLPPFLCLK
jgi:hypothetical protein